jgi:hypothetical protein
MNAEYGEFQPMRFSHPTKDISWDSLYEGICNAASAFIVQDTISVVVQNPITWPAKSESLIQSQNLI